MATNVIKLDTGHIKDCTIPAALQKIETAETAYVLTTDKNGRWAFQTIKGNKSMFELIGLLRCVSNRLEQMTN